jgi:hypothetical protein
MPTQLKDDHMTSVDDDESSEFDQIPLKTAEVSAPSPSQMSRPAPLDV